MKIFIVSSGYPTKNYKGNGIFEFDQAKALASLGHEVNLLAVDLRSIRRKRHWGIEYLKKEGISITCINLPIGRIHSSIIDSIGKYALGYLFNKLVNEVGYPDIIHAHFTNMGYYSIDICKKNKIPLVVTEHSSLINQEVIRKKLALKASKLYSQADCVIAVSQSLSDNIKKKFEINASIVPNIVDVDTFKYSEKIDGNEFSIVSVANLVYPKRIDMLVKAFGHAFNGNDTVKLYIFGDGPERSRIQAIIDKNNLNSRVSLCGAQTRDVIASKLTESDFFVLASQTETFGVVYIEALSVGVPVIATKCGGPEDFIDGNNGYLIRVDDYEQLVDALRYMYENAKNYNREKISQNIREKFSPIVVGKKLEQIYLNMLIKN